MFPQVHKYPLSLCWHTQLWMVFLLTWLTRQQMETRDRYRGNRHNSYLCYCLFFKTKLFQNLQENTFQNVLHLELQYFLHILEPASVWLALVSATPTACSIHMDWPPCTQSVTAPTPAPRHEHQHLHPRKRAFVPAPIFICTNRLTLTTNM